jgi:hypothetical protein
MRAAKSLERASPTTCLLNRLIGFSAKRRIISCATATQRWQSNWRKAKKRITH